MQLNRSKIFFQIYHQNHMLQNYQKIFYQTHGQREVIWIWSFLFLIFLQYVTMGELMPSLPVYQWLRSGGIPSFSGSLIASEKWAKKENSIDSHSKKDREATAAAAWHFVLWQQKKLFDLFPDMSTGFCLVHHWTLWSNSKLDR